MRNLTWPEGFAVRGGLYRHKPTGLVLRIHSADFETGKIELYSEDGATLYLSSAHALKYDFEEAE